jgi:hypothetical protein
MRTLCLMPRQAQKWLELGLVRPATNPAGRGLALTKSGNPVAMTASGRLLVAPQQDHVAGRTFRVES